MNPQELTRLAEALAARAREIEGRLLDSQELMNHEAEGLKAAFAGYCEGLERYRKAG